MQIQLKLMGMLKQKSPESGMLELASGAVIRDALLALEIDVDSVHVFTLNDDLVRDKSHPLADGDLLSIFPPVGGG